MERLIRRTPEEKREIIHLVEHSNLSVKRTLEELGDHKEAEAILKKTLE